MGATTKTFGREGGCAYRWKDEWERRGSLEIGTEIQRRRAADIGHQNWLVGEFYDEFE